MHQFYEDKSVEWLENHLEHAWTIFRMNSCWKYRDYLTRNGRDWKQERLREYDSIILAEDALYEKQFLSKQEV